MCLFLRSIIYLVRIYVVVCIIVWVVCTFGKGGCLSMVIVSSWRCKHIKILAAFSFGLNLTNGEMGNMRI